MLPAMVLGASTGIFLYNRYDVERIFRQTKDSLSEPSELWNKIVDVEKKYRRPKEKTMQVVLDENERPTLKMK